MAKGIGHWYVEVEKQAFWRGKVHTWVNRYVMSGADPTVGDAGTVLLGLVAIENKVYPPYAAGNGVGFVEARVYGSEGGTPLYNYPYNASLDASTATGFTGPTSAYTALGFIGTLENCLSVVMPLQGLSSTGKPVTARKYLRGILATSEAAGETPIPGGDITKVNTAVAPWQTGVNGTSYVVIGTSGRLPSGAPTAQPFISNHQVPRGRKKLGTSNAVTVGTALGYAAGAAGSTPPSAAVPKRPSALEPAAGDDDLPFLP